MERFSALGLDFLRDRRGATALEYGFIAFLISIAAVATIREIGPALATRYAGILPGFNRTARLGGARRLVASALPLSFQF